MNSLRALVGELVEFERRRDEAVEEARKAQERTVEAMRRQRNANASLERIEADITATTHALDAIKERDRLGSDVIPRLREQFGIADPGEARPITPLVVPGRAEVGAE